MGVGNGLVLLRQSTRESIPSSSVPCTYLTVLHGQADGHADTPPVLGGGLGDVVTLMGRKERKEGESCSACAS